MNTINKTPDNLLEFAIPNWALCSLINSDDSGIEQEDIDKIDTFCKDCIEKYGNANFMLGGNDEEDNLGFCHSNDIDSLGMDCTRLFLFDTKAN